MARYQITMYTRKSMQIKVHCSPIPQVLRGLSCHMTLFIYSAFQQRYEYCTTVYEYCLSFINFIVQS